ncbi:MAG: Glu/Leu/Phe/Val dehydrogenase [Patescibacteria group bacterium]
MSNPFTPDSFGPEAVVMVSDPMTGMRGFLVIDNTVLGPGKGGIRMTGTVTAEEVMRLARTMTWKNAIAGIPFGGAKAGMVWEGGSAEKKEKHVAAFARALSPFIPKRYIAGPDVNSGENEMKWFADATGKWNSATGKPRDYCARGKPNHCGIPHEVGSTGFGVAKSALVTAGLLKKNPADLRVAIEGFGNVGSFAFHFLKEAGCRIVAVSDSKGTAVREEGFDEALLKELKSTGKSVADYPGATRGARNDIFSLDVDILIPATVTDVITEEMIDSIRAKMIVEGANIPMQEKVERALFERGIVIVPDFVANAGGVISSYAEYRGYSIEKMFSLVEKKITAATKRIMKESLRSHTFARDVGMTLAQKIVSDRMARRNV